MRGLIRGGGLGGLYQESESPAELVSVGIHAGMKWDSNSRRFE